MSLWIENLRLALADKSVVLLHGNVRDRYVEREAGAALGRVYENLTAVIHGIAPSLGAVGGPENLTIRVFDPARTEETLGKGKQGHESVSRSTTDTQSTAEDNPDDSNTEGRVKTDRILARWCSELSRVGPSQLALFNYIDKAVPYKSSYDANERVTLLWLEKIIENIETCHRLVLVALQDTMLPVELYVRSPKCRVLQIPLPDREDRRSYLAFKLGEKGQHLDLTAALTEGVHLRELDPIAVALRQSALSPRSIRRIVNRHRVGVEKDYWGEINLEKLNDAKEWFIDEEGVKGQDEAVAKVVDVLHVARAGLSGIASGASAKPKGVLFFAGPTGVGKTLLAKKLAKFLFDTEAAFVRCDMSELKEEHMVSRLLGSPPGYVGYERGGMLTNAVRERPFSVLLFDEIEKAHPLVMDIFLQLLDDGRLTDGRGQTVFFTETIVIFTTNIGSRTTDIRGLKCDEREQLDAIRKATGSDPDRTDEMARMVREHFVTCVERFFTYEISRPELLNRIGNNIIPFNFIDTTTIQRQMVDAHLRRIKAEFEERYLEEAHTLSHDEAVATFLADKYSARMQSFGGRGMTNAIEDELIRRLAPLVLRAEMEEQKRVEFRVSVSEGGLTIQDGEQ